jgi:hypothetical protein
MIGRILSLLLNIWIISVICVPTGYTETWLPYGLEGGGPASQIVSSGDLLYVKPDINFVHKSSDYGATWNIKTSIGWIDPSQNHGNLLVSPNDSNTLFIVDSAGNRDESILKSTDGGASWSVFVSELLPDGISTRRFPWDIDSSDNLWIGHNSQAKFWKVDSSGTATDLSANLPTGTAKIYDIKVANKDGTPNAIIMVTDDGVYYSTNGTTWTQKLSGADYRYLGIKPSNDDIVVVTLKTNSGTDIYKSTDYGQNWSKWNTNPAGDTSYKPVLVAINNNDYVCVLEGAGEKVTSYQAYGWCSNDGVTWNSMSLTNLSSCPTQQCQARPTGYFGGITWYITAVGTDFWVSSNYGPWKSTDNGATFSPKMTGFYNLGILDMFWQAGTYNQSWAIAYDHPLWKSSDGQSWTNVTLTTNWDQSCTGGAADPSDYSKLYVMCAGRGVSQAIKVWKSIDGGSTWSNIGSFGASGSAGWTSVMGDMEVSSTNGTKLVACVWKEQDGTEGGIWTSADSGATWTRRITEYCPGPVVVDTNGVFYVQCRDNLYRATTTNLSSWTSIYAKTIINQGNHKVALAVDPNDGTTIYAALDGYIKKATSPTSPSDFSNVYNFNSARNLQSILVKNGTASLLYLTKKAWDNLSYAGEILRSTDTGSTWATYMNGYGSDSGGNLYEDGNGNIFIYLAGTGYHLYKLDTGATPPPPPDKQATSTYVTSAPTVDGDISDAVWSQATAYTIDSTMTVIGSNGGNSDISGTFKSIWTDTQLCFAFDITDDNVQGTGIGGTNLWKDDSVEVYVDRDNSQGNSYDTNDWQLGCDKDGNKWKWANGTGEAPTWMSCATSTDGSGWNAEICVNWANIDTSAPTVGDKIGFDAAINDSDTTGGGARESQLAWNGDGSGYQDPSQFGEMTCSTGSGGGT